MKISDNMSSGAYSWQLRGMRAIAVVLLIFAAVNRAYVIDLLAFSAVLLGASLLFARRRAAFLLEVRDCGDFLRLRLDSDELVVDLCDVEKVGIRDGKDGRDWVIIQLRFESQFGRCIQFYPDMVRMPNGRLDIWLAEFNGRLSASRSARDCLARVSPPSEPYVPCRAGDELRRP